jgi:hypothetical protein
MKNNEKKEIVLHLAISDGRNKSSWKLPMLGCCGRGLRRLTRKKPPPAAKLIPARHQQDVQQQQQET